MEGGEGSKMAMTFGCDVGTELALAVNLEGVTVSFGNLGYRCKFVERLHISLRAGMSGAAAVFSSVQGSGL